MGNTSEVVDVIVLKGGFFFLDFRAVFSGTKMQGRLVGITVYGFEDFFPGKK